MDLLPCPFCGEKAKHNNGGNSVYGRLWDAVWCDECEIGVHDREVWDKENPGMLDPAYPRGECFVRWNTRAADPARADALAAEVERLRGAALEVAERFPKSIGGQICAAALRGDANG